jgi:hypothetical protein
VLFGGAFGAVLLAMAGVQGVVSLAVGFMGIRMLGQGALSLTASTTVAVSFEANRGTALGLFTRSAVAANPSSRSCRAS